jgi:hypothetical protein
VVVTSVVANYAPTVEDRVVTAIAQQALTVELRGHDEECDALTYHVTSMPTEGTLYLCSCDNIWTVALTADALPVTVPGPCQRVVYVPAPNSPTTDVAGAYDTFTYTATDSLATSNMGAVSIFMDATDADEATPVAGAAGLALQFDGVSTVLSLARTPATLASWAAFSVEMRFRSLGDAEAGVILAQREGMFQLGWTAAGVLAFTVYGADDTVMAYSNGGFADRHWHHVVATASANGVTVYVDGELLGAGAGVDTTSVSAATTTFGGAETLASALTSFNGQMDEVRVWTTVPTPTTVTALALCAIDTTGEVAGVLTYLRFTEGEAPGGFCYDATAARNDGILGRLDSATGMYDDMGAQPTFVASTAVFGNVVTTLEDTAVAVPLYGADVEGGVTFFIATLPLGGELFTTVDGVTKHSAITTSPFALPKGVLPNVVIYEPAADANGLPYDIFKYQAYDGESFSYRQGVLINVVPVDDVPVVVDFTAAMSEAEVLAGAMAVKLTAMDPDAGSLTLNITTLPLLGALYHSPLLAGAAPMALGEMVMDAAGIVIYVPLVNAMGAPYDTFGFKAFNQGEASAEAMVSVEVPWKGPTKPVAGEAGYALYFDGMDDSADLGKLSAVGVDVNALSVELWFKTNALLEALDVTLLVGGPYQLRWSKAQGFLMQVGDTVASTGEYFNDGAWHYVSATWAARWGGSGVASLIVDGVTLATASGPALDWSSIATDPSFILGLDPSIGESSAYKELVDGVSVWGSVRSAAAVAATATTDLAQINTFGLAAAPSTPAMLFKFNEACGAEFTDAISGRTVPGRGADETTAPSLVPSTAPYAMFAAGVEEKPLTVQLPTSAETCEADYPVCVLRAPASGALTNLQGAALPSFPVTVMGGAVVFTGELGTHGEAVDSIAYMAGDCALLELEAFYQGFYDFAAMGDASWLEHSTEVTVSVSLDHVNHKPTACISPSQCTAAVSADSIAEVAVTLPAFDIDGDELAVSLTYLPAAGYLSTPNGTLITTPGYLVAGSPYVVH